MTGKRPDALKPGAFFRTVKERVPELLAMAKLELELFSNLDSSEMQPELWTALASLLHRKLPDFDGAVITHGTDTLAYTACALSFMLPKLTKPVVLTGAQRPLGEVRSDARLNLIDAVTSALHGPRERGETLAASAKREPGVGLLPNLGDILKICSRAWSTSRLHDTG